MTTCYKLTYDDYTTRNNTSWGEGITHELPEKEKYTLCSGDVIHGYSSAELAVLMDVIYGGYLPEGILWECIGEKVVADGTIIGCRVLTTLRQITVPSCTLSQRRAFGILCAQHVYKDPAWNAWANEWLSGKDRSEKSAAYAANCAVNAAYTAALERENADPNDYTADYIVDSAHAAACATRAAIYATSFGIIVNAALFASDAAHSSNNDYSFINNAAQAALSKEY